MTKFVTVLAALAVVMPFASAHAVDVINEDDAAYPLIIADTAGERDTVVEAAATLSGVCESCAIYLNDEMIEAEGTQVVRIKGGKLSIGE